MKHRRKPLAALSWVAVLAIAASATSSLAAPGARPGTKPVKGLVAQYSALRIPSSGLMKAPNPKLLTRAQSLTAGLGSKQGLMSAPSARLVDSVKSGSRKTGVLKGADLKALRGASQLNSSGLNDAQRARLVKTARSKSAAKPKR